MPSQRPAEDDSSAEALLGEARAVLQSIWGYPDFRAGQGDAVEQQLALIHFIVNIQMCHCNPSGKNEKLFNPDRFKKVEIGQKLVKIGQNRWEP